MRTRTPRRGHRRRRMPGVAALHSASQSRFSIVPEHLYIGSCLQEGAWSPKSDGLSVDHFMVDQGMYRFLNSYTTQSGGKTPPLSLFLNMFPGLQYVDDVNRQWAAQQLHHKFEKQRMRAGLRAVVDDLEHDDLDAVYSALAHLARGHGIEASDGVYLDDIRPERDSAMLPHLYDSIGRCGGIRVQDYVLIAARTSVGKSYRLMQHAVDCLRAGHQVRYFSLEMKVTYCAERLYTMILGPQWPSMENDEIKEEVRSFQDRCEARLVIYDQHSDIFTPAAIRRRVQPGDVVFIDHVGLMKNREGRRMIEDHSIAGSNSQDIKDMIEQEGVTVFAGIQANRAVGDQMPNDMFLQYSDSYGLDADIGIGLLRKTKDLPVTINQVFKHRHGSLEEGRWFTNFDPKRGNFEVVAPEEAMSVMMDYQNSDLA